MKDYYWLAYPVAAVILIIWSINYLIGGQDQAWFKLLTKHQKVVTEQAEIAKMQEKLTLLTQTNPQTVAADLAWLDQVAPRKKQVDVLVNELHFAAQNSGSILQSFSGSVGQVTGSASATPATVNASNQLSLQAVYLVPDFTAAQRLLASLQNTFPLLEVSQANYTGTALTVGVVSSWASDVAVAALPDSPLPTPATTVQKLRIKLANYQIPLVVDLSQAASSAGTPATTGNPFTVAPPR